MSDVIIQPLTATAFAPFGEVMEVDGAEIRMINQGNCERFHAIGTADCANEGGRTVINLFRGKPYDLPLSLSMVERHPLGSQAFFPLTRKPWLVVVAEDADGVPVNVRAFLASADQGINFRRNTWHGVLTPLDGACDFLVVDRDGPGNNLEEFYFDEPVLIQRG